MGNSQSRGGEPQVCRSCTIEVASTKQLDWICDDRRSESILQNLTWCSCCLKGHVIDNAAARLCDAGHNPDQPRGLGLNRVAQREREPGQGIGRPGEGVLLV